MGEVIFLFEVPTIHHSRFRSVRSLVLSNELLPWCLVPPGPAPHTAGSSGVLPPRGL